MKYGYYDTKDPLQKRLNRVEGQVRGISKMVQDDKYCIDVLTQISAAQAALDKVALELLRGHARHCLTSNQNQSKDGIDKADELVGAISRML
ncbi:metal-sensitive transcriptional regulator [Candidatus Saccharibacteria bacterium]|nr:metal-sensitive transcriptional regulator [Candidatus Saccharibacteria bacterium]